MTERPTYLPMLEAIANAERQGHEYYQAWYDHATDPDLKETMRIVATRELEHSLAFTKRIDELGFECQPAEILDFTKQIEIVTSDCSDYEKLQALELTDLADKILDPEERPVPSSVQRPHHRRADGRAARALHRRGARLRADARRVPRPRWLRSTARPTTARTSPSTGSRCSRRSSTQLCAAVEQLQATVSAKPAANGKAKTKATAAA